MLIKYIKDTKKTHGKRLIKSGTLSFVSNEYGRELINRENAEEIKIEDVEFKDGSPFEVKKDLKKTRKNKE